MQLSRRRSVNGGAASSRVRVAVRIRPPECKNARDGARAPCVVPSTHAINAVEYRHNSASKTYTYDHVFGYEATQEDVYGTALQPLMGQFLDGFNVTVMAYGQTGSGKTYTMGTKTTVITTTPTTSPSRERASGIPAPTVNTTQPTAAYRGATEDGLIPRFLSDLFANLKKEPSVRTIHVTFVEIYCDTLRDLLNGGAERNLSIREDTHNVWVENLHSLQVDGLPKALELLNLGRSRQAMGANALNDESSRSHAVYTMEVVRKFTSETKKSKLTFVDLAGSERIKKTQVEGVRKEESIQINVGLSALSNVINALADEKMIQRRGSMEAATGRPGSPDGFVPYRTSKLTRLLRDSLGGTARTLFVACVSPLDTNSDETKSTLLYANRARNIQNKTERHVEREPVPVVPQPSPSELDVARLLEEVARLKQQVDELTIAARERDDAATSAEQARAERKQQKRDARRDVEVTTEFIIMPHCDAETQADPEPVPAPPTVTDTATLTDTVVVDQQDESVQSGVSFSHVADIGVGTSAVCLVDSSTEMDAVRCHDVEVETDAAVEKLVTADAATEYCVASVDGSTETEAAAVQCDAEAMTDEVPAMIQVDAATECDAIKVTTTDQATDPEPFAVCEVMTETDAVLLADDRTTVFHEATQTATIVMVDVESSTTHSDSSEQEIDERGDKIAPPPSAIDDSTNTESDEHEDTPVTHEDELPPVSVDQCGAADSLEHTASSSLATDEKSDDCDPALAEPCVPSLAKPPCDLERSVRPSLEVPVFSTRVDDTVLPLDAYPSIKFPCLPRIAKHAAPENHDEEPSLLTSHTSENQAEVDASTAFVSCSWSLDDEEDELLATTTRDLDAIEFTTTDAVDSDAESDLLDANELPVAPLPPPDIVSVAIKPALPPVEAAVARDFTVRRSPRSQPVASPRQSQPRPPSIRPLRLFSFDDSNPTEDVAATLRTGLRELAHHEFGTAPAPPPTASAVDQLLHETSAFLAHRRRRLQRISKRRREIQSLEHVLQVAHPAPISERDLQAYSEATQDQFLHALLLQLTDMAADRLQRRLQAWLQADAEGRGQDPGPFLRVDQCQACAEWFFHRRDDRAYFTSHVLPLVSSGWISLTQEELLAEHEWLHL